MEVQELRRMKRDLEDDVSRYVLERVVEFERLSGVVVSDVSVFIRDSSVGDANLRRLERCCRVAMQIEL